MREVAASARPVLSAHANYQSYPYQQPWNADQCGDEARQPAAIGEVAGGTEVDRIVGGDTASSLSWLFPGNLVVRI